VIEGHGLVKRFGGRTALDSVDLGAAAGEIVGLLGDNGAGKTTTFRLLAGIYPPDSGRVTIDGRALTRRSTALRANLGLVPQAIALYPTFTAQENLRIFGRMCGVPRRRLRDRVDELLGAVGLADRADDPVHQLSGGMARRLNLAVGLVHRPTVLLLDEPVVGVDPQSRRTIFSLIAGAAADGAAVVYTSHQLDEAERLCDRFVVLDQGKVIASGALNQLRDAAPPSSVLRVRCRDELAVRTVLADLPWVLAVVAGEDATLHVEVDDASRRIGELATALGASIDLVEVPRESLEHLFLDLTGAK